MNESILAALQQSLTLHWTALETYRSLAVHFGQWGYPKLASKFAEDAKEEAEHADRLLCRLEFFDRQPLYDHQFAEWHRHDAAGILGTVLGLERASAEAERAGAKLALDSADDGTAAVFRQNLEGSEEGVQWAKAALQSVREIGMQNWLAAQI